MPLQLEQSYLIAFYYHTQKQVPIKVFETITWWDRDISITSLPVLKRTAMINEIVTDMKR